MYIIKETIKYMYDNVQKKLPNSCVTLKAYSLSVCVSISARWTRTRTTTTWTSSAEMRRINTLMMKMTMKKRRWKMTRRMRI